MKLSPCCSSPIIKKKRYAGQITLDYCKKCHRRVWNGTKTVTREKALEKERTALAKKIDPERKARLLEAFISIVAERNEKD